ncbi:COMM domain-containing protein 4 [Sarcoptes scabiei]|nr:COMM domain-containing protein 4 [Sarcoptes scabiei]
MFKFCGGNDCQDWILAQINLMSQLTSIKLKLIIKEVVNEILTEQLDINKALSFTADAKLDTDETKAILAALHHIIISSVKYNTESETVSNELQQLGLPKEHSIALSKIYTEFFHRIKKEIHQKNLKLDKLNECFHEIVSDFNDQNVSIECPSVILTANYTYGDESRSNRFHLMPEQLDSLINDMKEVYQLMQFNEKTDV